MCLSLITKSEQTLVTSTKSVLSTPTRGQVSIVQQPPQSWIKRNEKRLVAVLSCDPSRQEMLTKALTFWEDIGAKVLVFVPDAVVEHFQTTHANPNVRVVSYTTKDPAHMFVGHARNAVLQFCSLHLDVLRTMVVADERVYALNEWTNKMKRDWQSDPAERFFLMKEYLARGRVPRRGNAANDLVDTFDYVDSNNVSLLSVSQNSRNRNLRYPDIATKKPIIAQLIMMKLGENGWHGQFWYPETTMGEDVHFAYKWSEQIGGTMEWRGVTMLRSCASKSLTRKKQDLTTYSEDNLLEAKELFQGNEYSVVDGQVRFQWSKDADPIPLSAIGKASYDQMAGLQKSIQNHFNTPIYSPCADGVTIWMCTSKTEKPKRGTVTLTASADKARFLGITPVHRFSMWEFDTDPGRVWCSSQDIIA